MSSGSGDALVFFKFIIIVQIFFGISISIIGYAMPDKKYLSIASMDHPIDVNDIGGSLEDTLDNQVNIPLIDMGAMMFYTSNLIIDMVLNSFFAIPEMISIILHVYNMFYPVDPVIYSYMSIAIFCIFGLLYILAIIVMVMNLRRPSGAVVA